MSKRLSFTLNILAIAIISGSMSFVPEYFPDFFGDYVCAPKAEHSNGFLTNHPDETIRHWGYRHYLWVYTGVILVIGNIIFMIDPEKKNNNDYNDCYP